MNEVLLHIDDAQSWLSRARKDYCADSRIRGELDLVLAQAETRFAWELSRGRRSAARSRRRFSSRWWLPLAAGLAAIAIVLGAFARWLARPDKIESAAQPPAREISAPATAGGASSAGSAAVPRQRTAGPAALEDKAEDKAHEPPLAAATAAPSDAVQAEGPGDAAPSGEASPAVTERATVHPQGENLRAAGTESGLAVDLNELARVARETLSEAGDDR